MSKNKLTVDEWNLLMGLTEYNHMDTWFDLRESKKGYAYVCDLENGGIMKLRDAVEQIAEGMNEDDLELFENGIDTWNGLMEHFGLREHKVNK